MLNLDKFENIFEETKQYSVALVVTGTKWSTPCKRYFQCVQNISSVKVFLVDQEKSIEFFDDMEIVVGVPATFLFNFGVIQSFQRGGIEKDFLLGPLNSEQVESIISKNPINF